MSPLRFAEIKPSELAVASVRLTPRFRRKSFAQVDPHVRLQNLVVEDRPRHFDLVTCSAGRPSEILSNLANLL